MANVAILEWQNENGLMGYPLTARLVVDAFIVDASFIQFDGFVPILKTVSVGDTTIDLEIQIDTGVITASYTAMKHESGDSNRFIRLYANDSNTRYVGCLSFGPDAAVLWSDYAGRKFTPDLPFLSTVVQSIPSKSGVYTLESLYGNVLFHDVASVFFNKNTSLESLTFNAIANNKITPTTALKHINKVPPKDNNIYLTSNDVIKLESVNNTSLKVSLVNGAYGSSFKLPSLIS